jgi:DedD protein
VNTRYETDNDLQDLHDSRGQDREISLGTTTILGIFFALALVCAVFFGFGYGMGRRSAQPVAGAVEPSAALPDSSVSKPSSGSPLPAKQSAGVSPGAADDSSSDTVVEEAQPAPTATAHATPVSRSDLRAAPAVLRPASLTPVAAVTAGSSVVQVAAVSHQEDANVLVSALRQRGYSVAIRHEPQDKLLHVQIGPFATKKDADAMRQRLQADGYNAIVK